MPDLSVDMTRGVYRRIYSGYVRGRRINSVSMNAEAWFWRINAIADDFGNFRSDPRLMVAEAAPLRKIGPAQAKRWMKELIDADLIRTYDVDGEHYGHIVGFAELQPAGRNGKRVQRQPREPESVSGCVRVNPEKSGLNVRPETETEEHSHKHSETEAQADAEEQPEPAGAADSDSTKTASDPVSGSGSKTTRQSGRQRWLVYVSPLWAPGSCKQGRSDRTSSEAMYDELIWPDGVPPPDGRARLNRAITLIDRARRNGKKPMAWLTTELRKALPEVEHA